MRLCRGPHRPTLVTTVKIITTADGSHSLLNEALHETYHSHHGAVQESMHVFIEHGLHHLLRQSPDKNISILEIGFGTGLNVLLTWRALRGAETTVRYTSIESFPLDRSVWGVLNYALDDEKVIFENMHASAWNEWVGLSPAFQLYKWNTTLQQASLGATLFDLVYYDAFAPGKQPEMWTREMLTKVVSQLRPGGVLVTYCAKGQLKRDLKALGLEVESLQGPPGKKEMTRATKR
ncbi:MAG: tRNA (5-methylaminomethyl-2-thiouridine)(34)-methyltransferase MnmD [Bacteroidia bacterium]|nr:tRNA (5-methylaminomethyl-2-thiouridine)(34)-methyltransferase MnmD [Bacteroidia bacterium]